MSTLSAVKPFTECEVIEIGSHVLRVIAVATSAQQEACPEHKRNRLYTFVLNDRVVGSKICNRLEAQCIADDTHEAYETADDETISEDDLVEFLEAEIYPDEHQLPVRHEVLV